MRSTTPSVRAPDCWSRFRTIETCCPGLMSLRRRPSFWDPSFFVSICGRMPESGGFRKTVAVAQSALESPDGGKGFELLGRIVLNGPVRRTILAGLTSTEKERIPDFLRALEKSGVRQIALFPTVLEKLEREELYRELEGIPDLRIPHVHLRTDCDEAEMVYLVRTFATEAFNIHPRKSVHAFGPVPNSFAEGVFVENTQDPPEDAELGAVGGICIDYSHLESARRLGWNDYVAAVEAQLRRFPIGCCHIAAIREGDPNAWNGGPDHHNFKQLSDFDYLAGYTWALPPRWLSLELENPLEEQLEAIAYLRERIPGLSAT